jgi:uncharacterized membrane protein YeaQ/YmgE (transglycosylase-associated protein family)
MIDGTELQLIGIERRDRLLRVCGYAAVTAFCAVSFGANVQYGLSLGRTPIDKTTYAAASVAVDIFKMAAPLLVLSLRGQRQYILATAGFVLWLGCVAWSMTSAVGFVLSTRGEVIAEHAAKTATRHGWEAKVERDETELATLGRYRPSAVIEAELASAAMPLHIWRRSRQCSDMTLAESRSACAPVLGLRKELAAAEAAERLEAQLVAGRVELATAPVAGSVADPQAGALARLLGLDETRPKAQSVPFHVFSLRFGKRKRNHSRTRKFIREAISGRFHMLAPESVLAWIVIGAIAGWLAGLLIKGYGFGLIGNIVIGILGAGIAGILAPRLGLYTASTGGNIVAATVGALILLFLIGLVRRT